MGQKTAKRLRKSAREPEVGISPEREPDVQSAAAAASAGHRSKPLASSAAPNEASQQLDVSRNVDFLGMVREMNTTGGPAQTVREFVSNSIDSGSSSIKFAPLPYPSAKAGFAVADDGQGMSRPSSKVYCS